MLRIRTYFWRYPVLLYCSILAYGCGSATFFKAGKISVSGTEQLEVEYLKDLLLVNASVNGHKGRFILDNGASVNVLTPHFAARAGVVSKSSSDVTDANDKTRKIRSGRIKNLRFGSAVIRNSSTYIAQLQPLFPCDSISGILGANLLNQLVLHYRPAMKSIAILSEVPDMDGTVLPLSYGRNNSVITSLQIDGDVVKTKLDFGSNKSLQLYKGIIDPNKLGETARTVYGATSLSLFGIRTTDTTIYYRDGAAIQSMGKPFPSKVRIRVRSRLKHPAYLGMGYLKNVEFLYDGPGKRLVLGRAISEEKLEQGYGIAIYPVKGYWKVIAVDAHKAPYIPLGSKVEKIDEIPIGEFADLCTWEQYLADKKNRGEDLVLQLEGLEASEVFPLFPY